ncbi:MAG: FtsB family cell division protein [Candidatus Eiseniibacteriota bacterium]
MSLVREVRNRAKAIALPVLGVCLVVYFAIHIVQGDRGLIALWQLHKQIEQADLALADVKAKRAVLEHRVQLLSAEHLDDDMLDERTREILNVARPDELVIYKN